jgi:hypothetical protein
MSGVTAAQVMQSVEHLLRTAAASGGVLSDIRYVNISTMPESYVLTVLGYPAIAVIHAGSSVDDRYLGEGLYSWRQRLTIWLLAREYDVDDRQTALSLLAWEEAVRLTLDKISQLPGCDEHRFVETGPAQPFMGAGGEALVIGVPVTIEVWCHNTLVG